MNMFMQYECHVIRTNLRFIARGNLYYHIYSVPEMFSLRKVFINLSFFIKFDKK